MISLLIQPLILQSLWLNLHAGYAWRRGSARGLVFCKSSQVERQKSSCALWWASHRRWSSPVLPLCFRSHGTSMWFLHGLHLSLLIFVPLESLQSCVLRIFVVVHCSFGSMSYHTSDLNQFSTFFCILSCIYKEPLSSVTEVSVLQVANWTSSSPFPIVALQTLCSILISLSFFFWFYPELWNWPLDIIQFVQFILSHVYPS